MTQWNVVPIVRWPSESTRNRKRSPFRGGWTSTSQLMEKELRQLRAKNVVLQMAVTHDDIRIDGWIRASASPSHPGVIVTFDSIHGPLSYPCDMFTDWQANVRAIGLALEALRKVDRYGVTKRGEQYTGWKRLASGENGLADRGREIIREHGGVREALKATHPDLGGDVEAFRAVMAAKEAP